MKIRFVVVDKSAN